MQLSCSKLNSFLECPRSYLNAMMYLEKEDFPYFHTGREGHEIIQKHISNKLLDDRLKDLKYHFPIVEEKDFDERLKFEIKFDDDTFIGFLDARNDEKKVFCDIKISTTLWTMKKFLDLMQRKVYQLAYPGYSFVGITAKPDLSEVYTIELPNRPKDSETAREWIIEGFKKVKESKYEANPDANCHRCVYRKTCSESKYAEV